MSKIIPKFRPYLSVPALNRIISLLPNGSTDEIDREIYEQITIILTRNGIGAAKPAYIATPKPTLAEKIGIDGPDETVFDSLKKQFGVD